MSDPIFSHERNLGIFLVPIGVIGLIGTFVYLIVLVRRQEGISTGLMVTLSVVFLVSVLLTALGSQVKVISSLSSGSADEFNQ